jgi:hypothetical protein
MKAWAIAFAGVIVILGLAVIGGAKMVFATSWVMVAFFWLLFVWLVSTVVARRAKRSNGS